MGIDWGLRTVGDGKGGNHSTGPDLRLKEGSRMRGDVPTQSPDGKAAQSMLSLPLLLPVSRAFFLMVEHLDDNDL